VKPNSSRSELSMASANCIEFALPSAISQIWVASSSSLIPKKLSKIALIFSTPTSIMSSYAQINQDTLAKPSSHYLLLDFRVAAGLKPESLPSASEIGLLAAPSHIALRRYAVETALHRLDQPDREGGSFRDVFQDLGHFEVSLPHHELPI
jgi:hypothetical protein